MHNQNIYISNFLNRNQHSSASGIKIMEQSHDSSGLQYSSNNKGMSRYVGSYGPTLITNVDQRTYVNTQISQAMPQPVENCNSFGRNLNTGATKILVNPHFKKNVHINPNFKKHNGVPQTMNIHINPIAPIAKIQNEGEKKMSTKNIHLNPAINIRPPGNAFPGRCINNIHVNPQILKNELKKVTQESENIVSSHLPSQNEFRELPQARVASTTSEPIYKSKSKLIRLPVNQAVSGNSIPPSCHNKVRRNSVKSKFKIQSTVSIQKRRNSVLSRYKIVKSSVKGKQTTPIQSKFTTPKTTSPKKGMNLVKTRYKIIKSKTSKKAAAPDSDSKQVNAAKSHPVVHKLMPQRSKYRLDNRLMTMPKKTIDKRTKYVYVDKFYNITHLAKNMLIKQGLNSSRPGYLQINGILYKKSPNSMRKANIDRSSRDLGANCVTSTSESTKSSPYITKKVRCNSQSSKSSKLLRTTKLVKISPSKLRKSNVPCPMYRKFGRCSGKDNGKCIKIHDTKHIVLCTKFLQGACVNKHCLLSHEISPEKMPTCKYFLDGKCSRDDCQYLHVKISPKADICSDFLQGFCKKATECNKRHQFLCPDYEKHGKCPRKRCSFPHGERVRKINSIKKNAKKCSDISSTKTIFQKNIRSDEICSKTPDEKYLSSRYYQNPEYSAGEPPKGSVQSLQNEVDKNLNCDTEIGFRNRPKLGDLPAYIPLVEKSS